MKDRAWTSRSQELVDASSQLSAVFTEGCGCQRRGRRRRLTLPTPRCWQDQLQQRPLAIEAAGPQGVQFSLHVNRHSRYEDWTPRPERLDTVEEVSELPSESVHSLRHDGVRWPEQPSQHTSLNTEQLPSLNSPDLTSLQTEKKESGTRSGVWTWQTLSSSKSLTTDLYDRDARKLVLNNIKYERLIY